MTDDAHVTATAAPPVVISSNRIGGLGGANVHPSPTRDARLESQALSSGWAVPEPYKAAMVKRQIAIAMDPKSSERDATRAFVAVRAGDPEHLAASKPNMTQNVQVNNGIPFQILKLVPMQQQPDAEALAG